MADPSLTVTPIPTLSFSTRGRLSRVDAAVDAMTDLDHAAHENSVGRIFPGLGETGSAAEIVRLLDRR